MVGVILFRAQPFHNGHLFMVRKALQDCMENDCDLYIFVGSADKKGTARNPIPIEFRTMLIEGSLHEAFRPDELKRIHIYPLNDLTDEADNSYNWGRYLFMKMYNKTKDSDMTIYYSDKPEIMLSWFDADDRWCLRFKFLDRYHGISATQVRNVLLDDVTSDEIREYIPNFVFIHLREIRNYLTKSRGLEEIKDESIDNC